MATEAEDAVRGYLAAVKDPAALRDDSAIEQLRAQLDATDDVVERLRLRAALEQAEAVDVDAYAEAFIQHAKRWADESGVSGRAFLAEGVPRHVLRRAKLLDGGRAQRGSSKRKRVTGDDVRAAYPASKRTRFTLRELLDASGASIGTVRNVVADDVAEGVLVQLGPATDHAGPGRAPTLYKRA